MNWLLIVAMLVICTSPLYAQGAQPDTAKLNIARVTASG